MPRILLLLIVLTPSMARAEILLQESFELQREGAHLNDIGYYSSLRARNNSCNSVDFGTCGNTCGNDNRGRCCRSNDESWTAETNGSVIEDWATARFNGGQSWVLNGNTHSVPTPVDGSWVYRAYIPDCSMESPYRCNDFSPPVRLRALIASTSGDNINSHNETRWYGFATWIDPAWNFDDWPRYVNQTVMSQHLPANYNIGGGGPLRLVFRKGWEDRLEWAILSAGEAAEQSLARDMGCDHVEWLQNGWGCTDRQMPILNPDGSSSGEHFLPFDRDNDTGHWIFWVFQIRNDSTGRGNGILRVWMRRHNATSYHQIVDYTGVVGVMSTTAPYFKFGISDKADHGACPEIIYYDNLRVGDENATFADVDPYSSTTTEGCAPEGCDTGFCADEVCCESACDGECEACLESMTGQPDGLCRPVIDGTDPDGECTDNGLFCNGEESCYGGACGSPGDPCQGPDGDGDCAESCDEDNESCAEIDPEFSACDDGLLCTLNDECISGVCAGEARLCEEGISCRTGECDEETGACTGSPVADGEVCDDGDGCTAGETCQDGICQGGADQCGFDDEVEEPGGCSCNTVYPKPIGPLSFGALFVLLCSWSLRTRRMPKR